MDCTPVDYFVVVANFQPLRSQSTSFALQASLSLCVCVFFLGLLPPCTAGQLGGKCTVTPERQMLYTRGEGCRAGGGEETGLWAIHCW